MKHGLAFRKLSRTSSHRNIMLRNLVSSLLEHGQIKTTVAKAKETARLAEKIITLGKRGDDWARMTAKGFLFKPDITIPLLFNEYAPRYASRPGGYTRIHLYGNRRGDNAPHAVIELVDGPRDLRFEMTARAVGRETVEAALNGQIHEFGHLDSNTTDSASVEERGTPGVTLRDITRKNLEKVLRYRSEEDGQRFRQLASDWANRLLSEPKSAGGLRHPVKKIHIDPQIEKQSEQTAEQPVLQRYKYPFISPEGKQVFAGERLLGITPSKESSPLATGRGKLGSPRTQIRSNIWDKATQEAVEKEKARKGSLTPVTGP